MRPFHTLSLLLCFGLARAASAQSLDDYHEFYRLLRVNAIEGYVPCYPTSAPGSEPQVYGVRRDTLGRPVEISRFFFGNLDGREGWATMRIQYLANDSTGIQLQRRLYFGPGGIPLGVRGGVSEEVLSRKDGRLLLRRLIDTDGKLLSRVSYVTESIYRDSSKINGWLTQEWHFGNGRMHYGTGSDNPASSFAEMPAQGAYYRRYQVNDKGELIREELMGLERRPVPYPGGELVHAYELNDQGQPARMTFLDGSGHPMTDSSGIAAVTYRYDDHGRIVEWQAMGIDGQPVGRRPDGVAAIRWNYRPFDGVLLGSEEFDAKGNPLPRQ
jgi:hypothetical protein